MNKIKQNLLFLTIFGTILSCGNNDNAKKETNAEKSTDQSHTYEKFQVKHSVNGNSLDVSIATDLPDNIEISLSVNRSYLEKGSTADYAIDYISEQSTVGQWENSRTISIDNHKWQSDLAAKQKEMASSGLGFDVDKISDSIKIYAVVMFSNDPYPNFKEKEIGQSEIVLYYPIDGNIEAQSKYGSYQSLKTGETYLVSKPTPLMPEHNPSNPLVALDKVRELNPENRITILSIKKKGNAPWYEVKAFDNTNKIIGTGWINSTALMGQELKIIK